MRTNSQKPCYSANLELLFSDGVLPLLLLVFPYERHLYIVALPILNRAAALVMLPPFSQ